MGVLESDDYRKTREALKADPIIRDMAGGVRDHPLDELQHEDGNPRWEFMSAALEEYKSRGGKIATHIGGPAEAILMILKENF